MFGRINSTFPRAVVDRSQLEETCLTCHKTIVNMCLVSFSCPLIFEKKTTVTRDFLGMENSFTSLDKAYLARSKGQGGSI